MKIRKEVGEVSLQAVAGVIGGWPHLVEAVVRAVLRLLSLPLAVLLCRRGESKDSYHFIAYLGAVAAYFFFVKWSGFTREGGVDSFLLWFFGCISIGFFLHNRIGDFFGEEDSEEEVALGRLRAESFWMWMGWENRWLALFAASVPWGIVGFLLMKLQVAILFGQVLVVMMVAWSLLVVSSALLERNAEKIID